jgi:hypothetical protein
MSFRINRIELSGQTRQVALAPRLQIPYAGLTPSLRTNGQNIGVNWFLAALIKLVEFLFFVGAVGSMIVVIWTTIEDLTVFRDEEEKPAPQSAPRSHAGDLAARLS